MDGRCFEWAWTVALGCCLVLLSAAGAQQKKLSREKVDELIKLQAPDEVIARHIRSEGVDFAVDHKIVDEITAEGAGKLTVGALAELIRIGSLEIHTEAGAHVLVDGKEAGAADSTGKLVLAEVLASSHTLASSLDGYQPESRTIQVAAGEYHREEMKLTLDRALLEREVEEVKGKLPRTADGSLALQANEGWAAANKASEAASNTRKVLIMDPTNPVALEILAESALVVGDLDSFSKAALNAIRAGGRVEIPLEHSEGVFQTNLHNVTLTLDQRGISFHDMTQAPRGNLPTGVQPYSILSRIITQEEEYREMRLQNVNPIPAILLGFIEPRKFVVMSTPMDYDTKGNYLKWQLFVMPGTEKEKRGVTWKVSAPQYLDAVQRLIEQLMRQRS